jgi:ribosome-associated toxin RatA of RatAB toxin-antitoxin module
VEQGPSNSRRLYAGIDIAAPWDDVWSALTDYDGLADFIPGLAKNECLSRHPAGARLLQIGEQSLAMGLKFRARVVLDIEEHPSGLAHHLIDDMAVDEGRFPGPRSPPSEGDAHDISFALQEGDFQAFRGVWRMQQQDPDSSAAAAPPRTRLSYALFVRPQKWMPIGLIQSRIEGEVIANLTAVRAHAEKRYAH